MLIPTQFFWTYHPEVQLDKALPEIPSPSVFNLHFLSDVQSPAAFYQDKLLQVSHVLLHAYGLGHRLNLVPRSPSHSAERTRQRWLYSCEGMLGEINTYYFLPLENNTGISLLNELLFFFLLQQFTVACFDTRVVCTYNVDIFISKPCLPECKILQFLVTCTETVLNAITCTLKFQKENLGEGVTIWF